jgi:hypothetical protein
MAKWAKWLIQHRMRFMVYIIFIIAIPFVICFVIGKNLHPFVVEILEWIISDWNAIGKEK